MKQAISDIRHKDKKDLQEVQTTQISANALQKCCQRNDEFARSVQGRLQRCTDLVAEEALYYRTCYQKFFLMKAKATQLGDVLIVFQSVHLTNSLWLEKGWYRPINTSRITRENGKVFQIK